MGDALLIKICGLNEPEGLKAALDAGADLVGFVSFPRSPRHVEPSSAQDLRRRVEGRAQVTALLVDPSDAEIDLFTAAARPDLLQLHGHETPERVAAIRSRFGLPVMKVIGIAETQDLDLVAHYRDVADRLMLDAKPPRGPSSLPGGNGVLFDWRLLGALDPSLPFMLSGGLNPDNVAAAVLNTKAAALDVSSGVERAPGVKDPIRIAAFIAAARRAEAVRASAQQRTMAS